MKKGLVIILTIAAVVVLGNVLIASAKGDGTTNWPSMGYMMGQPFTGTMPFRGGGPMHGGMMAPGGVHESAWAAIADKLGMTYDELAAAVQGGKTMAQLADEKGVSLDALKQVAIEAKKAALADLVEQGVLTQEQADWMLDRMDDMPMSGFGNGVGPGGCHGGQPGASGVPGGMMHGWGNAPRWTPPAGNDG